MSALQKVVGFLGRLFLGAVFLITAVCQLLGWPDVQQVFLTAFNRWVGLYHNETVDWIAIVVPEWLVLIVLSGIILKLLGSLMLIFGWRTRLGATFLLIVLVVNTIGMHDFWHMVGDQGVLQSVMFLKNVAIMGGLLVVLACGKGSCHKAKEE